MIGHSSLLVTLVRLVDFIPMPAPKPRGPGRPAFYSDRLFLKALLIMIVRHLHKVHELLTVLEQPTAEMQALREIFTEDGKYPSRRTWERRLKKVPETLPAQIGRLGRYLVEIVCPWADCGRAGAVDSTGLRALGGVWHKRGREKGEVPHSSIDTEAHWTKSGWHGWIYGWKLHLVSTVASVWIPLAAELTPANAPDNEVAELLIPELPHDTRFLLGDAHYGAPNVQKLCDRSGITLVTTKHGAYPHRDDGVEVRRIFHKLRDIAVENFNEHFKGIFDSHGQVTTKGLINTKRFALGAIFVYQIALLYRCSSGIELNVGLKPFIKAA